MDTRRLILYLAIAIVGVMIWNAWKYDYSDNLPKPQLADQKEKATAPDQQGQGAEPLVSKQYVPSVYSKSSRATAPATSDIKKKVHKQVVTVKTDLLDMTIDLNGGEIISASLPKYPKSEKTPNIPIQILSDNPSHYYVVQTGLTNLGVKGELLQYKSHQSAFALGPEKKQLTVTLNAVTSNGLKVTKTFVFKRDRYAVQVKYQIVNITKKPWSGNVYYQITRRNMPIGKGFHYHSYDGPSISSPGNLYEKLPYKQLDKTNISREIQGGWVAMQQKYFLSSLIPPDNETFRYYSHVAPDPVGGDHKVYTIGYISPTLSVAPGKTIDSQSTFYVGPEIEQRLNALAKGLDLTIDYGFLWPISKLIFWVMDKIHSVVGNWGWSIVLVTLLIKLIFYPLSTKSYRSMAKTRILQPKVNAIRERYADNKQEMSKAMMDLYRKEKVSPIGGCLPMLIQVPVFIALYYVLIESVELRQAPFVFWIQDLSVKDPYYVLPILMGLTMLVQQRLSPPPPDPTQAKLMLLMPVIFTALFISFPAGLTLYWLTNNILSISQQWYVMKTFDVKAELKNRINKKKRRK